MKNYKYSLIRLNALVLVLMCHIFEQIGDNLGNINYVIIGNFCSVGVQIFLVLSGYLYGMKNDLFNKMNRFHFICKNIVKILKDYYITAFIILIITYLNLPQIITHTQIIGIVTFSSFFWGTWHMWYIAYILLCYIITPLLYDCIQFCNLNKKNKLLYLVILLIVIFIIGNKFCWYFSPAWISCYVIAFFMPSIKENKIYNRKKVILINIITIICYFIKYILRYKLLPNIDTLTFQYKVITYYIDYSRVLCGITIFINLDVVFEQLKNKFQKKDFIKKILDFSDKNSYNIYLIHMLFVKGVLTVVDLSKNLFLNILFAVLISTVTGALMKNFCDKLYNKWLKMRR